MAQFTHPLPHETIVVDETLVLQAATEEDATRLFELTDINRAYLDEYLPWVQYVTTKQDSLDFVRRMQRSRVLGLELGFGIRLHDELVGHISLMHINDGNMPEIGYWIAESASGKGVTKKAAAALTDFGFRTLGIEQILIRAHVSNSASNGVARSIGYTISEVKEVKDLGTVNYWVKQNV